MCICPRPSPLRVLIQESSCMIAAIARLSYAVEFVQVSIGGNYQVEFSAMFLTLCSAWSPMCSSKVLVQFNEFCFKIE